MSDEEVSVELTTATITIRHIVNASGGDFMITEVANEAGDLPPIVEVPGMLELTGGAIADAGGIYKKESSDD